MPSTPPSTKPSESQGSGTTPLAAEVIKAPDEQALLIESQDLLHDGGRGLRADRDIPESLVDSLPAMRGLLDPSQAEQQFVSAHERLVGLHAAAD